LRDFSKRVNIRFVMFYDTKPKKHSVPDAKTSSSTALASMSNPTQSKTTDAPPAKLTSPESGVKI